MVVPFPDVYGERRTVKKKRYHSGVGVLSVLIWDGDVKEIMNVVE